MTRTEQRQQLILVLRVDADAVSHPVMVSGKVLFRIPGHSVPADRHRVLDLVARSGHPQRRARKDERPTAPVAPHGDGHMAQ